MADFIVEDSYSEFIPRDYLDKFYSLIDGWDIGSSNYSILRFFAQAYSNVPRDAIMLEFGGGPTIHQLISAAARVKKIHFSDYLDENLQEVKNWKENKNGFNWTQYFKDSLLLESCFNDTLYLEEKVTVTKEMIHKRETLLRRKMTKFLHCNAFLDDPLGATARETYDIVAANLVTEGITSSKDMWKKLLANITSLLKEGGIFITTELRNADYWRVNDIRFPASAVTEMDLIKALTELGFKEPCVLMHRIEDPKIQGAEEFKGAFMLKAIK